MSAGVRGHDPLCPIARETWAVWTGDKCDYCWAIGQARLEGVQAARDAVARARWTGEALAAIDALRGES